MKHSKVVLTLALVSATLSLACAAVAQQALPTAERRLQLSAFGAVSGVFTGLEGGKNFAITAGGDFGLPPWRGIRPTLEVRGRYPTDHGLVDSQKDILGGGRVDFLLNHRLRPYGDFLFGRGQMNYGLNGYIFGNNIYALTTTYIDAGGIGFDYSLNKNLALKVDAQVERWGSAPTSTGRIYTSVGTAGLVYYFTFDRRHR
ncbi:MAG: hypothetical protein ABSG84_13010 [Acidobacteriaceae bacterium]|jgi:hypothetical protein